MNEQLFHMVLVLFEEYNCWDSFILRYFVLSCNTVVHFQWLYQLTQFCWKKRGTNTR